MQRRDLLRFLAVAVPALSGFSAEQLAALEQRVCNGPPRRAGLFDPQQLALVDILSEIIIPATDTPGAHAAGVAVFIERMVSDWYREDERVAFLAGINEVNTRSKQLSGEPFIDASESARGAVVQQLEYELKAFPGGPAARFWNRFKSLTVYGYYTSQPGVVDELETPFMPGFYDGDVPMGGARSGRH
jgi:hypothetical protein